jgi:hypothetical protein
MRAANAWLIVTAILAMALCLAIIWLFSDIELKFPGSERVDPSVRKQLGKFYLVTSGLTLLVVPVLFFNVESLRYWAGSGCLLLSFAYLLRVWRRFRENRVDLQIDSRNIVQETARVKESLSLNNRATLIRCVRRWIQITVIVLLYVYARGEAYFSLFDLFAFGFLLISFDLQFLTTGMELRKRLDWLKQAPTNPVR